MTSETIFRLIYFFLFLVLLCLSTIKLVGAIKDGRKARKAADREIEIVSTVNMLITLYFRDQFTHLSTPTIWIQDKSTDVDVKSSFLIRMQDFNTHIYCNVDWDGPNKVLVHRLADGSIFLDRSNGRKPTEEDFLCVTEKEFWTMYPMNFSVK